MNRGWAVTLALICVTVASGCDRSRGELDNGQGATVGGTGASLHFDNETDYQAKLAVPGTFKKELNAAIGRQIEMSSFSIARRDSSAWEKGGNLLVVNDDSLGPDTRVTCSLSPQQGDELMKRPMMGPLAIKGRIAAFSSADGLSIAPCTMTENGASNRGGTTNPSVRSEPDDSRLAGGGLPAAKAALDASTVTPAMIVGKWVSEYDGLNGCPTSKAVTYRADGSFAGDGRRGRYSLADDFLTESGDGGDTVRYGYVRDNDDVILARRENGPVYRLLRCPSVASTGT